MAGSTQDVVVAVDVIGPHAVTEEGVELLFQALKPFLRVGTKPVVIECAGLKSWSPTFLDEFMAKIGHSFGNAGVKRLRVHNAGVTMETRPRRVEGFLT